MLAAGTPACSIARSLPAVPTTPISQPGMCACSALSATCRWRPERRSRTRSPLDVARGDPERVEGSRCDIDHLRRPAFEHEQRPHTPPDAIVAAVEAVDEILGRLRIEYASTPYPIQ